MSNGGARNGAGRKSKKYKKTSVNLSEDNYKKLLLINLDTKKPISELIDNILSDYFKSRNEGRG